MKIVFAGSSDFGLNCLEYLIKEEDVVCVVTNPDKQAGRGKKISSTPVKTLAVENGIRCYQPENFNSEATLDLLNEINPDLIVVVSFGHIIKPFLLEAFPDKWINIHSSPLPLYRGPAPINFAIFNSEKTSGITIIEIAEKLDAGDILVKMQIPVEQSETFGSLFNKLQILSVDALKKLLEDIKTGRIQKIRQDDSAASYTSKITKEFCRINFNDKAEKIIAFIRGLNPVPAAWTIFNDKVLKIFNAGIFECAVNNRIIAGQIFTFEKKILVKCSDAIIEITDLQFEGKKRMDSKSFINGLRQ
ncbi:MAG TPA: methionyl-tRNA formyltransferase [bacterium]|nr:methionyl-tRNA formyltransferase [bacterium]HPN29813.1 methionyl-tRNA formyltransferase [bacterium]